MKYLNCLLCFVILSFVSSQAAIIEVAPANARMTTMIIGGGGSGSGGGGTSCTTHTYIDNSSGEYNSYDNPATLLHTPTGGATVVVVSIFDYQGGRTQTAPTIDGTTATQADQARGGSSPEGTIEVWYVTKDFDGSEITISVPNDSAPIWIQAASADAGSGCDSAFDVDTGLGADSGINPEIAITPTEDGAFVFAAMANGNTNIPTTDSPGTAIYDVDLGAYAWGNQYYIQTTAAEVNLGWTINSDDHGVVAVAFKPVSQ